MKKYVAPEFEIEEFELEDVLTTSGVKYKSGEDIDTGWY